jgi:hypothetical protein
MKLIMRYDTAKTQELFRNEFVGDDGSEWGKVGRKGKEVLSKKITLQMKKKYRDACTIDAPHFYYKALLSFAEGVAAARDGFYSWATIQLYYSVFYCAKSILACRKIALLRAERELFYVDLRHSPEYKKTDKGTDHGGTLDTYVKLFKDTDYLCSVNIEEKNPLLWMVNCREIVNYKDIKFHEPNANEFWKKISVEMQSISLSRMIAKFAKEKAEYCFQEESAVLALPVNMLLNTAQIMKNEGIAVLSEEQQDMVLKRIDDLEYEYLEKILFW